MFDPLATFRFAAFRKLERRCSVSRLYSLMKPVAAARALVNTSFKRVGPAFELPQELATDWNRRLFLERRMSSYLNPMLRCFQDRLAQSKWRDRCEIHGLEPLQTAVRARRPVILAFCHFGPYSLIRSWLRSSGVPAAILIGAPSEKRSRRQRLLDGLLDQAGAPTVIYLDQLREATGFAAAGVPLLVAIDGPAGKQIEVPFCDGWRFRMGTGAIRIAARNHAALFPCIITDAGRWHFRINIGAPVPDDLLSGDAEWHSAGSWLINQLKPHLKSRPDQCGLDLLKCLKRETAVTIAP